MIIRIKNLRLRTLIGTYDWERKTQREILVHIELEYDATRAAETDSLKDSVNYEDLTERITHEMEAAKFYLLEVLADRILKIIMENPRVFRAQVEVDKPHALRLAGSVSVIASATR